MKKISLIILVFFIAACSTVKEKTSGLSKITDTCPPKAERTLKHLFCKEPK